MCVLQMQESLTCQRKNAMIHLSGCGIQLVSKKVCLSRAPALHLLSTHVDLFAWRSSLPPPYRIRVDLLLRPCPKWNTSCALAILRTYNGSRVRLSVKSVGCPIPHFSVYKDARERPLWGRYAPSIRTGENGRWFNRLLNTCSRESLPIREWQQPISRSH